MDVRSLSACSIDFVATCPPIGEVTAGNVGGGGAFDGSSIRGTIVGRTGRRR